jgi:hypothetical protein
VTVGQGLPRLGALAAPLKIWSRQFTLVPPKREADKSEEKCTRANYVGAASTSEKPIFCVWRGVSIDCPMPSSCFEGALLHYTAHAPTSVAEVRMIQMPVHAEKATSRVVLGT